MCTPNHILIHTIIRSIIIQMTAFVILVAKPVNNVIRHASIFGVAKPNSHSSQHEFWQTMQTNIRTVLIESQSYVKCISSQFENMAIQ